MQFSHSAGAVCPQNCQTDLFFPNTRKILHDLKSIVEDGYCMACTISLTQATSHLYFSTLYSGIKGTKIGTVFTYFWYSGSLP